MRAVGLTAFVLCFAAASARAEEITPVPANAHTISLPGFSVQLSDRSWVERTTEAPRHDGTIRGVATHQFSTRGASPSDTAVLMVTGAVVPLPAGDPTQMLLSEMKRRADADAALGGRIRVVSSNIVPVTQDGAQCVRWDSASEDRGVPHHDGEPFALTIHALLCMHPDFPSHLIVVHFSQRIAPDAAPVVPDDELAATFASLHFTRWPWRVATIALAGAPQMITEANGAVWVNYIANGNAGYVARIDPATNAVVAKIPVGRIPIGIVAEPHGIWVANAQDGTVSRIDPSRNAVADTITVGGSPQELAVAAGSVWAANDGDGSVARIDPATGHVERIPNVVREAAGIAFSNGMIAVTDYQTTTIARIDPATNAVRDRIAGGQTSNFLLADGPRLWANDQAARAVLRIDGSGTTRFTNGIGDRPTGIAVWKGRLWVANWEGGTLTLLDPNDAKARGELFPTGPSPINLFVAHGALWVSVVNGRFLLRLDPKS